MEATDQFKALGPTSVGFLTHGTKITVGVDATGNAAGVIGRVGDSQFPGYAYPQAPLGVQGLSTGANGVGVQGSARDTYGCTGVQGIAQANVDTVIGVQGTAQGDSPFLIGVQGSAAGNGSIGVQGYSETGILGFGTGINGRGGVFKVENIGKEMPAQINLDASTGPILDGKYVPVPAGNIQELDPKDVQGLPVHGKTGDLLARVDSSGNCTLWFCINGTYPGIDNKVYCAWKQVLLGTQTIVSE